MKAYLPLLLAGLWLVGSCTTPDSSGGETPESVLRPADYTVLTGSGGTLGTALLSSDSEGIELSGGSEVYSGESLPELFYRNPGGLSFVTGQSPCDGRAGLYRYPEQILLTGEVLAGFDPCKSDLLSIAHAGTTLFLAIRNTENGEKPPAYILRKFPLEGGAPADLILEGQPVDLETDGNRIYVLVTNELTEGNSSRLVVVHAGNMEILEDLALEPGARSLTRVGQSSLLIGYPDLHQLLDMDSLTNLEKIRYQDSFRPGFCNQNPFSDATGERLFYTYPVTEGPWAGVSAAAVYDFPGRTLRIYYFDNFLTPGQLGNELDIGTASAVGYDRLNGLLLVGYRRASDPGRGGMLRLQIDGEFRYLDHIELPAAPFVILGQ
ncbi:hypothetical protein [Robiginitalea sp. SC105]|uniref:hypothetical protein n=1 Tax=Robiginitalea sp. SC105 TaxID=2762332 RepID=UPI00163B43B2|nr:hypothetical protein [Robiginitalea sp. SC105]MBC2840728.1 hypothetical protein [Robiginitalea sp. SC105]